MITYGAIIRLSVTGPDRSAHFEKVVDAFERLERCHEDLLDSAWGFANEDDHAIVDVELTVQAPDEDAAYDLAESCIRSAIHEVGGHTPNWGERVKDGPAYWMTDEIELISA